MNKKIKRSLLLAMVVMLFTVCFAFGASALAPTGQCGDHVYWEFDETTGELVISGQGALIWWDDINDKPLFRAAEEIKSVIIEEGIESIGGFEDCVNMESISLPNTLLRLDWNTFLNCRSLKKIVIPDSVEHLGRGTFDRCESLEEIVLPDKPLSAYYGLIGGTALYNNEENWENGLLYIGKHLVDASNFHEENLTIKDGTLSILCSFNKEVADISIPDSVRSITNGAFKDTAFYKDENNWEDGVLYVGKYLIDVANNAPSEVTVKEGSIGIADCAFSNYSGNVILPSSIKSVGVNSLSDTNIESIHLNEVEYISPDAFSGNRSLKTVYLGRGLTEIGKDAFCDCSNMEKYVVDEDNEYFCSDEYGVLYNKDKSVLLYYPNNNRITKYIVPETVKRINDYALSDNYYIEEVVFNDGLESIGDEAFACCVRLRNIVFPDSLLEIGRAAFCYMLVDSYIILPKNLRYLDVGALVFISLDTITIKAIDTEFSQYSTNFTDITFSGISTEELVELLINDYERAGEYMTFYDDLTPIGTLYCHPGSTAEAYAIENGIDYVTQHFYGEWISDFDNMLQYRVCETCGMREERPLTQEEIGGIEIITPDDPDHDFEVDEKEPGSDSFVLVQEILGTGIENCNVLKVFDITYKNKDGVHVQPDGSVRVKLPLDWEKDGIYKVYRVNDDGTYTDMNATRQGSHMVFETDHFSLYVIVDESEQKPDDTPERDFFQKIFDWFRQLLDLLIALFK